uniref:ORF3 n=1 Tax=Loa loa TaxID=7209 RepID=A0A1I7VQA2_LOALO
MTQISAKKSSVSQVTPLVKKKSYSRRGSRSRSRNRHSRHPTPSRSLASQTVKTDSVGKLLPTTVHHSLISAVKEDSTPFQNHSLVLINCL